MLLDKTARENTKERIIIYQVNKPWVRHKPEKDEEWAEPESIE